MPNEANCIIRFAAWQIRHAVGIDTWNIFILSSFAFTISREPNTCTLHSTLMPVNMNGRGTCISLCSWNRLAWIARILSFTLVSLLKLLHKKFSVDLCGSLGFINNIRWMLLAASEDYMLVLCRCRCQCQYIEICWHMYAFNRHSTKHIIVVYVAHMCFVVQKVKRKFLLTAYINSIYGIWHSSSSSEHHSANAVYCICMMYVCVYVERARSKALQMKEFYLDFFFFVQNVECSYMHCIDEVFIFHCF